MIRNTVCMEVYCVIKLFFHLIIKALSGSCQKINNFVEAGIGYFSYLLLGYHSICTFKFLEQLLLIILYRKIKGKSVLVFHCV